MNCFEWKSHAGDYMDGLLPPLDRNAADQHLDGCERCSTRLEHFRELANTLSHRPRHALPVSIRKAPLAFVPPKVDVLSNRSRWERAPWFVRTSVEGLGIAFLILFLVALVPKIRTIYERSLERRLDAFSLVELLRGGTGNKEDEAASVGMTRGRLDESGLAGTAAVTSAGTTADEFSGEYGEDLPDDSVDEAPVGAADEGIRAGRSEIWRFNIKTDSPREMRPKIVSLLLAQGLSKDTAGLGGVEAPGGIQFDLLVNSSVIANLRVQLRRVATSTAAGSADATETMDATGSTPTFTWYKNKSRRAIPAGKSRIVVWLSQM